MYICICTHMCVYTCMCKQYVVEIDVDKPKIYAVFLLISYPCSQHRLYESCSTIYVEYLIKS